MGSLYEPLLYIKMYYIKLQSSPPTVTIYGLVAVNLNLFLNMCGVIITYTVILLGFENAAPSGCGSIPANATCTNSSITQ